MRRLRGAVPDIQTIGQDLPVAGDAVHPIIKLIPVDHRADKLDLHRHRGLPRP